MCSLTALDLFDSETVHVCWLMSELRPKKVHIVVNTCTKRVCFADRVKKRNQTIYAGGLITDDPYEGPAGRNRKIYRFLAVSVPIKR